MIVLDTNVLSEEMRASPSPHVHAWLRARPAADLYTTAATEAEIRTGLALLPAGRRRQGLIDVAERVLALLAGRVLPFDNLAAKAFAHREREAAARAASQRS